MRHTIFKLLCITAILTLAACNPEDIPGTEPGTEEHLLARTETETVVLEYEVPTTVHISITKQVKNLTADITGLPEGIDISEKNVSPEGGFFTLVSHIESTETYNARLVVSDGKISDSRALILVTVKTNVPFTVTPLYSDVNLCYDRPDTMDYVAINAKGGVTASFKSAVEGLSLENIYDEKTGIGSLIFTTSEKTASQKNATVIFSDTESQSKCEFKINTTDWEAPLLEPEVILESNVIYPYETELVKEIPFTIPGEAQVDEIYVTAGNGLNPSIEPADDKKSGIIKVWATQTLQDSDIVTLIAKSGGKEAKTSFTLEKAYISPDYERIQVSNKGTESGYNVTVSTNLPVSIITPDDKPFVHCAVQGNRIHVDVDENTTMGYRYATISVTEPLGFLNKNIEIIQAPAGGSTETDKQALIAIYHALNIKDWIEYGAFGDYYSNWNTDAYLDMWLGTGWTGEPSSWSGHEVTGRCWYIHLKGEQPSSSGYIPEELGDLTKLVEFIMFPNFKITHLPESIKNLVNLRSLILMDNSMDYDISQWTGLHELMNNPDHKLIEISFDKTGLHGTFPEWVKDITPEGGYFGIIGCHFSGQVPDCVVNSPIWTDENGYYVEYLDSCPRFNGENYEKTSDGWYYKIPYGELMIYTQADNYALWVGERPENTKWVDDKFGGHWEWTD